MKITFFPNGRLRSASLARPELIQGAPCSESNATSVSGVTFYENGRLESCLLAADVVLEGRAFRKGTRIHFDHDAQNPRSER